MKKKIEVIGPGCKKCNRLAELCTQAAEELGIEYELIKITDIMEITNRGVIMTPGLIVDGELKITGKVPGLSELKSLIG